MDTDAGQLMPSPIHHLYPFVRFHRDVTRYRNSKSTVCPWLPDLEIIDSDIPTITLTWATTDNDIDMQVRIRCNSPWPYCAPTVVVVKGSIQSIALAHCLVNQKFVLWEEDWTPVWNFEGIAVVLHTILEKPLPRSQTPIWTNSEERCERYEMTQIIG